MASLQRKNTGLYYLRWTDSARSPDRITESLKTTEQSRALYLKRKLEHEYQEGSHDPWYRKWYDHHSDEHLDPTVNQAVTRFIEFKKDQRGGRSWNYNTYRQNKGVLERFAQLITGDKSVKRLSESDLKSYYYRASIKADQPRSQHTTLFERRIIRAFCRWCHNQGLTDQFIDVDVDRPQEEIPEFFTEDQLQAIWDLKARRIEAARKFNTNHDQTNTQWMIDAWKLAAGTGMRKSEISALSVDAVREDMIIVGHGHRTKSGKQRAVPVLFEAKEIVRKYLDPEFRKSNRILAASDKLFGREGNQLGTRISKEFTSCCRELWPDRSEFTLHSLRHTFAMRYLTAPTNGVSQDFRLYKLQKILGHADITTTMKYLKADPSALQL